MITIRPYQKKIGSVFAPSMMLLAQTSCMDRAVRTSADFNNHVEIGSISKIEPILKDKNLFLNTHL